MERNMKFLVVLAIWMSYTVVFGLGRVIFPLPINNYTVTQTSVSLSLTYHEDDKATYQQFQVKLRKELALGGTVNHNIPVLRATVSNAAKYLLVKIKNSDGKEITFGLSVINAYVLAYKVGDNSYFFKDPIELKNAQKYLFTDTRQVILTALSGNYVDFDKQGATRSQTDIGIGILNEYISTLYGKTSPGEIAKPLVCIIQMVAEAARFKYIENKIIEKSIYTPLKPGGDITSRENEWQSLSKGIQYADKDGYLQAADKKGKLKKTTVDLNGKKIEKVNQIDSEMGLLLYAPPVTKMSFNIPMIFEDCMDLILRPCLRIWFGGLV